MWWTWTAIAALAQDPAVSEGIDAFFRAHVDAVTACRDAAAARGEPHEGTVTVPMTVEDGRFALAPPVSDELHGDLVECVAAAFQGAPPPAGDPLAATYTLPATGPVTVSVAPAVIAGALDRSAIDGVIKHHLGKIRRCYNRALAGNANLSGGVKVKFVIAKDGSVTSAVPTSSFEDTEEVPDCVADIVSGLQFPEPRGGGIVIVTYPFVFAPTAYLPLTTGAAEVRACLADAGLKPEAEVTLAVLGSAHQVAKVRVLMPVDLTGDHAACLAAALEQGKIAAGWHYYTVAPP